MRKIGIVYTAYKQDSAMTDPNKTVFISYRRSTSQDLARLIFMDLRANGWDAFFDVNTIDSGMFDRIILNQIAARAHFVLVLAPGSLERCTNEGDWLRREIEEAIRLKRNVVPVMKEGFSFESEKQFLPESIQDLPRFNALRVPHDYFDEAMEKLRNRFLKQPFYGEVVPTPAEEVPTLARKIAEAAQMIATSALLEEEYASRGDSCIRNGDFEEAIRNYTVALELNPVDAQVYADRAKARIGNNDIENAIADYSKAIEHAFENQDGEYYAARGELYLDQEKYDDAIADFNDAIQRGDTSFWLYTRRGLAYAGKGELDNAIADYSEAIKSEPQNVEGYFWRGLLYAMKGDPTSLRRAVADYQRFLDIDDGETANQRENVKYMLEHIQKKIEEAY